ncbi:hypothetical protein [Haloarcula sp. JP-L23]|uniref:hypothetical protein n=1 Tax=Haloarcula sp. JP-L23 TaxID=2716717 RepID=UPI00140F0100|nr:hypothetical protein G9465_02865 [Haloarcula sp. JP-L23]
MARPSFSVDDELLERVDSRLTYGDNRSAWLRDAIELKLGIVEELDEAEIELTDEERREFVVEAVREAIENE